MPPQPKPVANTHDFHAHLEATCRAAIESELKKAQDSGQLPDLSPAAQAPGGPHAVGAFPGLGILAGLLAGPLVKQIEAKVLQQAEGMAENFLVEKAGELFPGVDTAIVQKAIEAAFVYVTNALTGTAPSPNPVA